MMTTLALVADTLRIAVGSPALDASSWRRIAPA